MPRVPLMSTACPDVGPPQARYQRLRPRRARVTLVPVIAACCLAIIPAFVIGGSLMGIAVLLAAWSASFALRASVRRVPDTPDRHLDERQRTERHRARLDAYRAYAAIVSVMGSIGLVAFSVAAEDDEVTLALTWNQVYGTFMFLHVPSCSSMFLLVLATALPSMTLAWRAPGEAADED